MTSPSIVVTTVHRTFAHDATWVQPESSFCTALREKIGADVLFGIFFLGWLGLIIAYGLVIAIFLATMGLIFRAIDKDAFYAGIFFDLSAEPSPLGQWVTYQLRPSNDDALLANDLHHSISEHPVLPKLIDG